MRHVFAVRAMLKDFSVQSLFMGILTAFVGFASSFAVVLHGLQAVGATDAQAASGLMALSISMGLCAIVLSIVTRLPVSIAWSTPGAALLASTGHDRRRFQCGGRGFSSVRRADRDCRPVPAARPGRCRYSGAACQCHACRACCSVCALRR